MQGSRSSSHSPSSTPAQQLSLRLVLLLASVAPLVGAVTAVGYFSFRNGQETVNDFASQMIDRTSDLIHQQLRQYLDSPRIINRINADAIQLGQLNVNQPNALTQQFWKQRFLFDRVCGAAIYYGNPQGEFTGLGLRKGRAWLVGRAGQDTGGRYYSYGVDGRGKILQLQEIQAPFDPRKRPWYLAAASAGQPVWTQVYPDVNQQSAKIALAQPIYSRSGELRGVIGVDCLLSSVGKFLAQVKVSPSGESFIIERSGKLIAASSGRIPFSGKAPFDLKAVQIQAIDSPDPMVRETALNLNARFGDRITLQTSQPFSFDTGGRHYLAQVTPFQAQYGLDWLIIVITPVSDFTATVNRNTQTTLWLSLAALSGAIALSIGITRRIAEPIRRLSRASQGIASGELDQTLPDSNIQEFSVLSTVFNQMAHQLQLSFETLEQTNDELERRVKERTTAFQKSEQRFYQAFQSSPNPEAIVRLSDQQILVINDYFLRMIGYSAEEVVGKSVFELDLWVDQTSVAHLGTLLREDGRLSDLEVEIRTKTGDIRTLLVAAEIIELDRQPCAIYVNIDITDRKRAENALQISQQQLLRQNAALVELTRCKAITQGDWATALQDITCTAAHTLDVDRVSVWLYEPDKTAIHCAVLYEFRDDRYSCALAKLPTYDYPIYFQALEADQMIVAPNATTDPRTAEFWDSYLQPNQITAMLDAPIQMGGEVIGVLCLEQTSTDQSAPFARDWTLVEQGFVRSLADLVALAIEAHQRQLAEAALRRSETALRASEANYRDLVQTTNCVIMRWDMSGRIRFLNDYGQSFFGYTASEIIGRSLIGTIVPVTDSSGRNLETLIQDICQHPEQYVENENENSCQNGDRAWLAWGNRPIRDEQGALIQILSVGIDITRRKRAEEALRESELKFRGIVENANDLIYLLTPDGRFSYLSPNWKTILGYSPEELIGSPLAPAIHPDDLRQGRKKFIQLLRNGQPISGLEHRARHRDGNWRWLVANVSVVRDPAGALLYCVGISRDISDRKAAEVELQLAKEAAEVANRAKSEFLANMSHELRTPLNGILGYAQILKRSRAATLEQIQGINTIYHCGEHLLTLINDVLDLSKIEARHLVIHPSDFNLPSFLQAIAELFQLRARQKSISFLYEPLSALPVAVSGDEQRLRQVLINLLGNAIKFTDRGGVVFKVGTVAAHPSMIRFQIEDTGIGIAPENLEEIFLPFQQVGDRQRMTEGTGLGLAISRKLVAMMGGELKVHSAIAQGSTFWFELPLTEVAGWHPRPLSKTPEVVGYQGGRRTLLVVDERPENRAVLVALLAPLGFNMIEADHGESALSKAAECHPDVIFMDLVMPVMDGFEATRQLRRSPDFQNTIIIAASASAFEHDQQASLNVGCNAFLPKPIHYPSLLDTLQRLLDLDWIYESPSVPDPPILLPPVSLSSPSSLLPPDQILHDLQTLAQMGAVLELQERVTQLEQADPALSAFAAQVRHLAESFQVKQLQDLLNASLLHPEAAPDEPAQNES